VRLTIDSNDNIDQVLQAVGAMFGVQVTASGDAAAATPAKAAAATPARRRGAAKKAPASRAGRARSTTRTSRSRPDSGAVREWARQNGFDVSERGRIPSRVIAAYTEANR
jgi:hypothetical protein